MSGLVARNCPSFINVVPIPSIDLHNFSSSLSLSLKSFFFSKDIDKRFTNNLIKKGGW